MSTSSLAKGFLALAIIAPAGSMPPSAERSINIPVAQLHFYLNKDGMTFANAWGDPDKGAHSNFIKIAANTASPLHTHTSAYYGVVIAGIVSNERDAARIDRPLRPGSYWFQKGGEPHVTKCLLKAECLIFVTSNGRFDFKLVPGPLSHTRR